MDELGIDDYTFSDMLLFREVCLVVSRRSANLSAAGEAGLYFKRLVGSIGRRGRSMLIDYIDFLMLRRSATKV